MRGDRGRDSQQVSPVEVSAGSECLRGAKSPPRFHFRRGVEAVAVAAFGSGTHQMLPLPECLRFDHSLFIPFNLK